MNYKVGDRIIILKEKIKNSWIYDMKKYLKQTGIVEDVQYDDCFRIRFKDGEYWYYDADEIKHYSDYLRREKIKRIINGKRKKSIW